MELLYFNMKGGFKRMKLARSDNNFQGKLENELTKTNFLNLILF